VTGHSVNVVAMIGAVMLAGIVVKNAIVLIDAVNMLRTEGMAREEALVEAGLRRMRPILMTTATTILGLLPMALGLGEGAELRGPLAVTVIGGLSVSTVLTLLSVMVVGGIAMARLPLAFLPNVDLPFIGITIPYPNSNPTQIEKQITKPVEEVLATIPGVKRLGSTSTADSAEFQMQFKWG